MHGTTRMSLYKHSCSPLPQCKHVEAAAQDASKGVKKKTNYETCHLPQSTEPSSFEMTSMHQVIRYFANCVDTLSNGGEI